MTPASRGIASLDPQSIDRGGGTAIRADFGGVEVKAEPRRRPGVGHGPEERAVSAALEDEFGFAPVQAVSFEDLFGKSSVSAATGVYIILVTKAPYGQSDEQSLTEPERHGRRRPR